MKPISNGKAGPGKTPVARSNASASPAALNGRWAVPGVCFFLAAITFAVFGQTIQHEFVNYDDNVYVYENVQVAKGLTLKGIVWAFTHIYSANWHPLTWLSHMLDCQLYGLNPAGHHLTNVLLHTAAAILLFLVLRRMTGFLWRSAFVAAVFAIHPLRVESVAWVAERKDVLSGVFFMLTLWAYARYAQRQSKVESRGPNAQAVPALDPPLWILDYGLVLLFFALGLMCKPMLVTLPVVLLLLDYWPLKRFTRPGSHLVPRRLIIEKVPLLVLCGAACVITLFAQTDARSSYEEISIPLRAGNALISYVTYLGQMFWPSGLSVLYPFTAGGVGVEGVVLSVVVLAGISTGVFVLRPRPYLLTGWLWYLVMLVPVIGIVQVGAQAHADRYTYLPQIGLYLLLTWAAADLCAGWRHRRTVLGGLSAVILVALICCARTQVSYWRNSVTLWTHTLACTSDNFIGHVNFGNALLQKGKVEEAITQYETALQIKPNDADACYDLGNALLHQGHVDRAITHYQTALQSDPDNVQAHINLGNVLLTMGQVDAAISHYQKALQIKPDNSEAHNNFGNALFQKGNVDEAITQYRKALQIKPDYTDASINLGNALLRKGQVDAAITQYQTALQINPNSVDAHISLGNALLRKGRVDEMIVHYQKVLQITPDDPEIQKNLAWVLATCPQAALRNGNQAVELAQRANQLTGDKNPLYLRTLAAAYAEAGRFPEAVEAAQRALQLAGTQSNTALANAIRSQMKLYQAGVPYHLH